MTLGRLHLGVFVQWSSTWNAHAKNPEHAQLIALLCKHWKGLKKFLIIQDRKTLLSPSPSLFKIVFVNNIYVK